MEVRQARQTRCLVQEVLSQAMEAARCVPGVGQTVAGAQILHQTWPCSCPAVLAATMDLKAGVQSMLVLPDLAVRCKTMDPMLQLLVQAINR